MAISPSSYRKLTQGLRKNFSMRRLPSTGMTLEELEGDISDGRDCWQLSNSVIVLHTEKKLILAVCKKLIISLNYLKQRI